jgi:hypothetical protein
LIQPPSQALKHADIPNASVTADDNLEDHIAGDATPPRFFRVIRLDLALQCGRRDTGAGPVRPTPGSAAGARSDSAPIALTQPGPLASARSAAGTGSL